MMIGRATIIQAMIRSRYPRQHLGLIVSACGAEEARCTLAEPSVVSYGKGPARAGRRSSGVLKKVIDRGIAFLITRGRGLPDATFTAS